MATFDYKLVEAHRYDIPFVMTYDATLWSVVAQRGEPVDKDQTSRVYFYIKNKDTDVTPLLALSDADTEEIEWTDEDEGKIIVKLGKNTEGITGDKYYELRVRFPDDQFVTAKIGKMFFKQSVVDTPDV